MGSASGIQREQCKVVLDDRLAAACDLVPYCDICADIGADHGKLSAALLCEGRANHVLVTDISAKALDKARRLLSRMRLSAGATFMAADGLSALGGLGGKCLDAVCILGMGGDTIAGILQAGADRLGGAVLVLGAHTELPRLRRTIGEIGYCLNAERFVEVTGRSYVVMRAVIASGMEEYGYTEKELLLGPCLLKDPPALWLKTLRKRERRLGELLSILRRVNREKDRERMMSMEQEYQYIREVLAERAEG